MLGRVGYTMRKKRRTVITMGMNHLKISVTLIKTHLSGHKKNQKDKVERLSKNFFKNVSHGWNAY
jgi:hypothetical protein